MANWVQCYKDSVKSTTVLVQKHADAAGNTTRLQCKIFCSTHPCSFVPIDQFISGVQMLRPNDSVERTKDNLQGWPITRVEASQHEPVDFCLGD